MASKTVDKPPRCAEGSFFTRTGKPAKYINSIRVQNLPKSIEVFECLRDFIIENEDILGPVLSIRIRKQSKNGATNEKDMVAFVRLYRSERHVQLLSCLDGEHVKGMQIKATNSNFTNNPHNDDFRFRDDVYWLEYVQYPTWTNDSWSWTSTQYGPDTYCNEDAWRDHLMHKERVNAYGIHQSRPLEQQQQQPTTIDLPQQQEPTIEPQEQTASPSTPKPQRKLRNAIIKALQGN